MIAVQKFSVLLSFAKQLFTDDGQRERGRKEKRSKSKMAWITAAALSMHHGTGVLKRVSWGFHYLGR